MAKKDLLEIIKHPSGIDVIRTVIPKELDKEKYINYFSKELTSNGFKVYDFSRVNNLAYFFIQNGVENDWS